MNVSPPVLDLNAKTNQWLKRLAVVALGLFLLLNAITAASVLRIAIRGADSAAFASDQADHNAQVLSILLEVTGCSSADQPGECAARLAARSISEGTRRIVEVDCATRRALAGLPAPDPTRFCVEQTPPDVYPG